MATVELCVDVDGQRVAVPRHQIALHGTDGGVVPNRVWFGSGAGA